MNQQAGTQNQSSERERAAVYVAELATDLATLARRHRLDTLVYLLDMVRLEAENVTRHINGRP
jgi:hypothetical protein